MDKFDRIVQLHRILAGRRTPIPFEDLRERLGCSKATAYRLIQVLEHYLGAPIERDEELGGFRYRSDPHGRAFATIDAAATKRGPSPRNASPTTGTTGTWTSGTICARA